MTPESRSAQMRSFRFTRTTLHTATRAFDEAKAKGITLRDQGMTGLICRKQAKAWILAVERKIHGKVRRVTLEPYDPATFNVVALRQRATEVTAELQQGIYVPRAEIRKERGRVAELNSMDIRDTVELLAEARPTTRPATLRAYQWACIYMADSRPMLMAAIDTPTAQRAFNRLRASKSDATALNMLRSMKALWNNWRVHFPTEDRPATNPFKEVVTGKAATPRRKRALQPTQRVGWFQAVHDAAEARGPTGTALSACELLFLTGLRLNEAIALRWDEIEDDVIRIPATRMKAGIELEKPITPALRQVLGRQAMFHGTSGWVFPARTGEGHLTDVRKAMWPINKAVLGNSKGITPHDLRRTYAASAALCGIPDVITKALLGHSIDDVTDGYIRSDGLDLHEQACRIEEYLTGDPQCR